MTYSWWEYATSVAKQSARVSDFCMTFHIHFVLQLKKYTGHFSTFIQKYFK